MNSMNVKTAAAYILVTGAAIVSMVTLRTGDTTVPEEENSSIDISVVETVTETIPETTTSELTTAEISKKIQSLKVTVKQKQHYSDEEIELLALVTVAEAEGESEYGKRLVIDTILNRVDSDRFPDTIKGVIYQKNQFTSMWNGRTDRCKVTDEVRQLVREEMESRTNSDVLFFTAGGYGRYGTPAFQVGDHYFCT